MIPFRFRKARPSPPRFFLPLTFHRNRQNGNRFYDVRSRRLFLIPNRVAMQRDGHPFSHDLSSPFPRLSANDEFLWREHLIKDFLDSWVSVLSNSIAITYFFTTISSCFLPLGLAPPFSYHSSHSSSRSSALSLSLHRCRCRRADLARKTLIVRKSKAPRTKKECPENRGVVAAGYRESPCRNDGISADWKSCHSMARIYISR